MANAAWYIVANLKKRFEPIGNIGSEALRFLHSVRC